MKQKTFEFMTRSEDEQGSDIVLDQQTVEVLVALMASALIAVVTAVAEVSDAR